MVKIGLVCLLTVSPCLEIGLGLPAHGSPTVSKKTNPFKNYQQKGHLNVARRLGSFSGAGTKIQTLQRHRNSSGTCGELQ